MVSLQAIKLVNNKGSLMARIRLLLLLILGLLASCAGSPAWQSFQISSTRGVAEKNNKKMLSLKVGQTKMEVMNIMGDPTKTESYVLGNGTVVEFYFYRTEGWSNHMLCDADRQFTPVAFQNDKLVGWGRNYYDRVKKQQIELKVSDAGFGSIPEFDPREVIDSF